MSVMPRPVIEPVRQPMYPTMMSLQDVISYAESEMPGTDRNTLLRVFGTYHNTLINLINTNQGVSP